MTGAELREGREALGLTAKAFANLFGVNERTLRSWERDEARAGPIRPPIAVLVRLALKNAAVRRELGIRS